MGNPTAGRTNGLATRFGAERANPAGRPHGSRHKLSNDFLEALCNDFTEHGKQTIIGLRESDPATYVRVIASLQPKEVAITQPLADVPDDQLDEVIAIVRAAMAKKKPKEQRVN